MNAAELLSILETEGLRLGLDDGGGLRCYGDRAKTSALLPTIRRHKPEILALLTVQASDSKSNPPHDPLNPAGDPELSRLLTLPAGKRIVALVQAGFRCEVEGGRLARVVRWRTSRPSRKPWVENQHQGDTEEGRVCCGDCGHFERDRIGNGLGIGKCAVLDKPPGGLLYPKIERRCFEFTTIKEDTHA